MEVDVLLLHHDSDRAFAEALGEAFIEKGVTFDAGAPDHPPVGERVLVVLGEVALDRLQAAITAGTAVLPVSASEGWLAEGTARARAQQVADAVDALLIIGRPARRTSDETIDRALVDIRRRFTRDEPESALARICETFRVAIQWGEPICEAGSPEGCARIYRETTELVLDHIVDLMARGEGQLLDAIAEELHASMEALGVLRHDAHEEQAWTLRHTFDRILVARRTADALYAIDDLFKGLMQAGRHLSATLIYDVVSLAISHGAPIYNAGSSVGCAQIYLCTAAGLLRQLGAEERQSDGRAEVLTRELLTPLVASGARRLQEDPDGLAWGLRRAFDEVVEAAAEERRWEHDS